MFANSNWTARAELYCEARALLQKSTTWEARFEPRRHYPLAHGDPLRRYFGLAQFTFAPAVERNLRSETAAFGPGRRWIRSAREYGPTPIDSHNGVPLSPPTRPGHILGSSHFASSTLRSLVASGDYKTDPVTATCTPPSSFVKWPNTFFITESTFDFPPPNL